MDPVELQLQTDITRAFILADSEEIVFRRPERLEDNAGGFKYGPGEQELAPQTCRLIPQSDRVPEIAGSNGRMAVPEWVIIMEPESDIARYDRFVWRGKEWEIAELHIKPDYQLKGDVILRGF